ncbi:FRG domain-containing protein [Serratia liquefaciens]|uniref:FRG domain-containing protein n=1 Tax=Serratia liquefaciens TaxID=614 RepID=UPI0022B96B56|nr:FRG domain-containing protein [Serratia liquefaciens]
MDRFTQIDFETADELWNELSPTRNLGIQVPYDLIFRGQGSADWGLIPSSLRSAHIHRSMFKQYGEHEQANGIVRDELLALSLFVKYCDRTGIAIPNDGSEFRQEHVGLTSPGNIHYITNPSFWPNPKLLGLMALAQHHGLATRLLDWTALPFTACYFAASSSVSAFETWDENARLAVWALDISKVRPNDQIYTYSAPGAISPNLAAQYGTFTVHPHNGAYKKPYTIQGLEVLIEEREKPILYKLTIPSYQAVRLLGLCNISGFSAADIYPSTNGVGIAVMDDRNIQAAIYQYKHLGREVSLHSK